MESEGPYFLKEHGDNTWAVFGPCSDRPFALRVSSLDDAVRELQYSNAAFAEGRKAAENYTELMLKHATAEVRRCFEEIRRLEDKYARKFHRVPEPIGYGGVTEKDFRELLEIANGMEKMLQVINFNYASEPPSPRFEIYFSKWKKARGVE